MLEHVKCFEHLDMDSTWLTLWQDLTDMTELERDLDP